ncbi:MAG: Spy/CpxP family protein refolding chaperone [Acidobacteriia bacterium]|nr:Spy/CpxP family protein refolding chaperone [Terriglobia bacterium]
MDTLEGPTQSTSKGKRRGLIGIGLVAALGAAVGIAWATGVGPAMVGHGFCRQGMGRDFVEFRIHKALTKVNASDAQEQQISAIVDSLFAKHQAMAAVHQQMHQQILAALTGATVDRAAIETVRAGAITLIDQGSKDLAKAVGDIADVLTPAQRQQLAALAKEHMQQ